MSPLIERARARHPGMHVLHPPQVWSHAGPDGEVEAVDALVDALVDVASGALGGSAEVTLLVNNVTVDDPGDVHTEEAWVAPGDYVVLTIERGGWEVSDSAWRPIDAAVFVDATLDAAVRSAGVVYAYARGAPRPSITCFLTRR
jgi:hypothetical protein